MLENQKVENMTKSLRKKASAKIDEILAQAKQIRLDESRKWGAVGVSQVRALRAGKESYWLVSAETCAAIRRWQSSGVPLCSYPTTECETTDVLAPDIKQKEELSGQERLHRHRHRHRQERLPRALVLVQVPPPAAQAPYQAASTANLLTPPMSGGDAGVSKPASMPSQQKRRSKLIAAVQSSLAMRQGISWEAALAADAPVEEVYVAASRLADTLKLKKQLQLAMPLLKGVQQEADLQAWRNRCLRTILQPLEGPPWEDAAKRSSALTTSARSKPPHSTSGLCRWLPEKCWEAGGMAVPLEIPTTLRFSTRRELVTVAQMNHSIQGR
eukprot:gene9166-10864_t